MDFLDIVKAIFYRAGANIELTENANEINKLLKDKNKTVFEVEIVLLRTYL